MPEQLERDGVPARRVPHTDIEALFADLDAAVRVYEETGVLSSVAELERILAVRTAVTPWIAAAMPRIELAYAAATDAWRRRSSVSGAGSQASLITSPSDTFVQLYRNSFYKNRMMGGPLWSREKRRSIGTYG
ncbi:MAG: hypothetical protein GWN29_14445, partial [Gammaproteobacteria bacterium]|nr:hypothetical protein [Gammaproteobacteria bacterium]